jgi:hypothetical protein
VGNIYDEGSGKISKCLSTCVSENTKTQFVRYSKTKGLRKYVWENPKPHVCFSKKKKKKKKSLGERNKKLGLTNYKAF